MNPRPVKSLAEVAPNQRVSFAYYGGENEGATRTVDVTEVSDDRIYGVDVDKQEPRQYLFDKAAIVLVLREANEPEPAEAATEVEPPVADVVNEPPATTRVRRTCLSFIEARQRLHDQIDTLNGEDLAEVLAEVEGEDRGCFDAANGQVVVERDVPIPYCKLNMFGDIVGVEWVNEDGEGMTTVTSSHDDLNVTIELDGEVTNAEDVVRKLAQHFGLTVE